MTLGHRIGPACPDCDTVMLYIPRAGRYGRVCPGCGARWLVAHQPQAKPGQRFFYHPDPSPAPVVPSEDDPNP